MNYFYPSKVNAGSIQYPYMPEKITNRVMLNPKYQIKQFSHLPYAICDSGAFQDIDKHQRLTPDKALQRQLAYEFKIQTQFNNYDWRFESFCIYDQMIGVDECIIDGKKIKQRGTEETGKQAIEDTLRSAVYYNSQRNKVSTITYIAQGVTTEQYMYCTKELLMLANEKDYYGFGGFCITGKQRKVMLPLFFGAVDAVLPLLRKKNIKRAHILGVCLPEAITYIVQKAKVVSIEISTDSSAPELNAVAFGKVYNEQGRLHKHAGKKWIDYNPIDLAHENVRKYDVWMKGL